MKNIINNENTMDKDTITNIKKELLLKRDQLLDELKSITGNVNNSAKQKVKFPDFGNKNDENAQEIDQYSTNLATEKVLEKTLRDINNTLDRIEKGKYGICKYCGKDIGKKRMLARPVASACVECKTKLQNG
jgi:DnaK suppressor protein